MLTPHLPGTGGRIKERAEDFVVDEIPAYLPAGEGDHVMVRVRKRGVTTDDVARALASFAGVSPGAVGVAGRKDKHAVTTQWLSVPATRDPASFERLAGRGFEVLEAGRHRNKLRTGHLHGNRFRVVVRGVVPDALERARAILEVVARDGLPNSFGPQRFGRGGANPRDALEWIEGSIPPPESGQRCKLLISSLQALLFNQVVQRRLEIGALTRALRGDVMKLHGSGGMFVADDPEAVTPRVQAREVSPTGPIFGARMWWPDEGTEAYGLEATVLADAGLTEEHLDRFRRDGSGSRRPLRVFPAELSVDLDGDSLVVSFALEPGAFATTLLAEVTKAPELRCPTSLDHDARESPAGAGDGE